MYDYAQSSQATPSYSTASKTTAATPAPTPAAEVKAEPAAGTTVEEGWHWITGKSKQIHAIMRNSSQFS